MSYHWATVMGRIDGTKESIEEIDETCLIGKSMQSFIVVKSDFNRIFRNRNPVLASQRVKLIVVTDSLKVQDTILTLVGRNSSFIEYGVLEIMNL